MKKRCFYLSIIFFILFILSCEKNNDGTILPPSSIIADHEIATESVLRSIPVEYIDLVRSNLHVAYQHTSHGTHVSYGLFGLQDFEDGDDVLFGITNNNPTTDKLDFRDCSMAGYAEAGESASDLSANETGFIQATRKARLKKLSISA